MRATHDIGWWMLLRVLWITHPEQFVNRPILAAIDRVEDGLACGNPNQAREQCGETGIGLHAQNDWLKVWEYRLESSDLRIYGGLFDRFDRSRLYRGGINCRR